MAGSGFRPQPPARRLRVMHLLPFGHLGGGPETVRLLARGLDREQFEVSVVCPDSPMMDRLASVPEIKRFSFTFTTVPTLPAVRRLATLIRAERVDILHTHLFHGDLYGFLATRLISVPLLVSTVQGVNFYWEIVPFPRKAKWWVAAKFYRGIYHFFDGVATCSEAVKREICSRPGIKVGSERVRVIHNSVDVREIRASTETTQESGARASCSSHSSPLKRLISVANFDPIKGQRVLLEALRRLAPEISFECLLVGDGPDRLALEAEAEAIGLADVVRFLGYRDDVPALLRGSDLFVLSSFWEGLGIALLEAMALGVPVVACASGGVPEVVIDGETGVLVPPGVPVALAAGIKRVLSDSTLAEHLTQRACRWVESRFDAGDMVSAYERWYEELVASKGLFRMPPTETASSFKEVSSMTSFRTSFGRTIEEVPGYLEAHPRQTAYDVIPPKEGYQGFTPFGIDGFINDLYEYALMIDLLEGLGIPTAWGRALDVGGAEGTISRLLRGESRAKWVATLDLQDFGIRLATTAFLRHWLRFRLVVAASRFSPKLRRFLLGDGEWRGKRLTAFYPNFGYVPPRSSTFWTAKLRAVPRIDQYIVGDFYELNGTFDLITSFLALPCFDVERFFAKVSELLSEGGTFFFICDYWWFPVNSALLVGHFPYVGQRLTESDFRRYVEEFHPGEIDDWMVRYYYFHQGKQRPTLDGYAQIADRFDLELLGSRRLAPPPRLTHNRAVIPPRLLNRFDDTRLSEVLEDVRQFRPDVGLIDLMTNYVMAAFVKRSRHRMMLSQYLVGDIPKEKKVQAKQGAA